MKTIDVDMWEVTAADGAGWSTDHVAYFSDGAVATALCDQLAKEKNWPHYVNQKTVKLKVFESVEEYVEEQKESAVRSALAKLTDKEKKLLGLEGK